MQHLIKKLTSENRITIIEDEVDIYLEIAHIAYIKIKQGNAKPLLFTNVVDRKKGKKFSTPVLINLFASYEMVEEIVGDVEKIANEIQSLTKPTPPIGFMGKMATLSQLISLKSVFPKRLKGKGECQEIIKMDGQIDLYDYPILTTWEGDSAPFITMGQVYTQSLDKKRKNLGMYRLQVHSKNKLGMHFQIHKDSNTFLAEYKKAGKKMPVSIAIGGDPLYTWCATAPLPPGIFELLLYGFIRKKNARLVRSLTNELYIPHDADIVIEGEIDPSVLEDEGPFGDHTGYYTLKEPYPVMEVKCITQKKKPIYLATVVGKPPLEDKYMGYPTERIFLPLLRVTGTDLIDYYMPENGVFHNLILCKIAPKYPSHAKQIMHALWGVGQMSFVKHALFVNADAPALHDGEAISDYILNHFSTDEMLISYGVCDALDHSSNKPNEGGKLGLDATGEVENYQKIDLLDDATLLAKMQVISNDIRALKQYKTNTKNPICVIAVEKNKTQKMLIDELQPLFAHIKILVIVDEAKNNLDSAYMLIWRVVNNIDAKRDVFIYGSSVAIDATNKSELDGFMREWPEDTDCTKEVLEDLQKRGLIKYDDKFIKKYLIY